MIFAKPWWDALIVLLVILLFFGPKRLPALGKSLGEGMREFKDSITGHSKSDDEEPIGLTEAAPSAAPVSAPPGDPPAPASPDRESAPVASSEPRG
jgi:sec-independent protein translocase protein TatA